MRIRELLYLLEAAAFTYGGEDEVEFEAEGKTYPVNAFRVKSSVVPTHPQQPPKWEDVPVTRRFTLTP